MFHGDLDYFQKPLLVGSVDLTQNQESIALWMLIAIDLFYLIMCEGLHE